jgi:hypothetical protein
MCKEVEVQYSCGHYGKLLHKITCKWRKRINEAIKSEPCALSDEEIDHNDDKCMEGNKEDDGVVGQKVDKKCGNCRLARK